MYFRKKIVILFFIFTLIFTSPMHVSFLAADPIKTMDLNQFPYQQKIEIPIDTSLKESKYQPIDIRISFDTPCYALNETMHSIRVGYQMDSDITEIESQIYDLKHIDENHITSCSLVFLIPAEATGEETYSVYYDDKQTDAIPYPDHLTMLDTHYYYEPITGQIIDFDYYQVIEDEYIIYGICQKGELLGNGMSNAIIKLLPNSTEFKTKNAEQIAGFYTSRSIDPAGEHMGTQWAEDITKSILIDGNLMIRLQIKGTSPDNALKTDNIYTYYYRPTDAKSLHVNINHEVLKDITITGTKERVGTYASLSTIKARSGTIEDMNLGEILPNIHFYTEDGTVREYDITTDPDADPADWLLSASDDQDLGTNAWICIDDVQTGQAHGLIFESNQGIVEGEYDGIQVKASVKQHVKLPGLEADSGDLFAMRNAYENGNQNNELPQGLNVTMNVQYMALQTGGYQTIDNESKLYQILIQERPITRGNGTDEPVEEQTDRYILTALIHMEPSFPLGPLLSAGTGRNFSYLTAELYKNNALASSGSASRLKLGDINIAFGENDTAREKIRKIRSIFDIRNSTFFKTIRFPDLEPGIYLIKIYKENAFRASDRLFVGYKIVEVTEDTRSHIFCKPQTTIDVTALDQKEQGIAGVTTNIYDDDVCIAAGITADDGTLTIPIPLYARTTYNLQAYYDGFIVSDHPVTLNVFHRFRSIQEPIALDLYQCKVTVKDTLDLAPAVDLNPTITSTEMSMPQTIPAEKIDQETYLFTDLLEQSYQLKLSYKSFELLESLSLTKDITVSLEFPAEFHLDMDILNTVGNQIDAAEVSLKREGKTLKVDASNGAATLSVPPGSYLLSIELDDTEIAKQTVEIKGDKQITLVSNLESFSHTILPILLIIAGLAFCVFLWLKQKKILGIHVLILFILLSALFQPWWHLSGETDSIQTTTNTYLYPATIITLTSSSQAIGGEVSEAPEEFTMILELITLLLIIGGLISLLRPFFKNRYPKLSFIILVLSIVVLLLCGVLFYVAMSEVTKVGVGQFFGTGDLSISLPGETQQELIPSSWGAGSGFYLLLTGFLGLLLFPVIALLRKFGISLYFLPF